MTAHRWRYALMLLGYSPREIEDALQSLTISEYDEDTEYVA